MTNRRKFLALLGVGTASAPLAAKELMDNQALDLTLARNSTPLQASEIGIDDAKDETELSRYSRNDDKGLMGKAKAYMQSHGKIPPVAERYAAVMAELTAAKVPQP